MKRRLPRLFLLLALSFVLASTAPAPPASAQAVVFQDNMTVPIDFFGTSCTGEQIHISGDSHVIFHAVGMPGNRFQNRQHIQFNLQGVSDSGTLYNANETVNGHMTGAHDSPQSTFSSVGNLHLVSQGSGDNLTVRTTIHTTVNANGEITANTFVFESRCGG